MAEKGQKLRCAVYTRKSSEEGLEQDFNSLHAQREACEAYIKSQKHEGWRLIPIAYDDGGFSGGTMERPGLQKLMADVLSGGIDVVVVYKVDRLTRSLTDFARIIEAFDRHNVSFVSVTQAFNTTTSMGRLTLNVLLSFAQFEREVTGERIRDKIAASKQKGLWMGGCIPFGYDANGRTLAINELEAEIIRTIYRRYLDLRSVDDLKAELDGQDIRTRLRSKAEQTIGGKRFVRGHLYAILENPLYAGKIRHKGIIYDGKHPAIIDPETWDSVQQALRDNRHVQRVSARAKDPNLLAGLLFDAHGEKLIATHCVNHWRRYRYYVSPSTSKHRRNAAGAQAHCEHPNPCNIWRLPASEIEPVVLALIARHLKDHNWVLDHVATEQDSIAGREALLRRAAHLASQLEATDHIPKRGALLALVHEIVIDQRGAAARLRTDVLRTGVAEVVSESDHQPREEQLVAIEEEISFRRHGPEMRLTVSGHPSREPEPDPALIKALAQAHRWWDDLLHGRFERIRDLAAAYETDRTYVARVLRLAFLAPGITRAVIEGDGVDGLRLVHILRARS